MEIIYLTHNRYYRYVLAAVTGLALVGLCHFGRGTLQEYLPVCHAFYRPSQDDTTLCHSGLTEGIVIVDGLVESQPKLPHLQQLKFGIGDRFGRGIDRDFLIRSHSIGPSADAVDPHNLIETGSQTYTRRRAINVPRGFPSIGVLDCKGQMGSDIGIVRRNSTWRNPGAFISLEGSPALRNSDIQANDSEESYYSAYPRDPIQMLSRTKLRSSVVALLGISCLILGIRLLSYGDRVGNFTHEIEWWTGYGLGVVGGFLLFCLVLSLVGQC
jgi:hypothetical protein